jgi:membrane associated rhomboid family serine protease
MNVFTSRTATGDFRLALKLAAWFTLLIWLIWSLGYVFEIALWKYGIFPGRLDTLYGVLTAPLVHANPAHLTANTLPLLVMLTMLFYIYPKSSPIVLVVLYVGSGLMVWFIGRPAWHFGASGITHGLMFYLFVVGILRRDAIAIAISMIVFFLYGGMVWGIFPRDPAISFEYHLSGAVMGMLLAILLRNYDKKLPVKRYDWEDEEDFPDASWKQDHEK